MMIIGILGMGLGIGMITMGWNAKQREHQAEPPKIEQKVGSRETGGLTYQFFWYGCPHCLSLESAIIEKGKSDPSFDPDRYTLVPLAFKASWELHGRLFYALEEIGFTQADHLQVMTIIQDKHPSTEDEIIISLRPLLTSWAGQHDEKDVEARILALLHSPQVNSKITFAQALARKYGIPGVPAFVLQDGQLVLPSVFAGYKGMIEATLDPR